MLLGSFSIRAGRAAHQCLPIFLVGSLGLLGAIRLVDEPTS